jgi:hypothetical protein
MADASTGQLIDSPSGRVARAQEIDAAWQQLWQAEYTGHIEDGLRAAFEEDYRTWQRIKEQIAAMGVLSLMSPGTGDLLERWHVRAADWFGRFKEKAVPMAAPAPKPDAPGHSFFNWQGATGFAWAIAGIVGSGAVLLFATNLANKAGRGRVDA